MALQTESRLVEAFQADKNTAFATLYTSYGSSLLGVLVRMVTDESRAEDLLHDAFIRIWTSRHRYDATQGRLFTWLLTITRNVALDELSSRRRHHRATEYLSYRVSQPTQLPALQALVPQPLFEMIPPKYRRILELTCQGYTKEEIAHQLSLPIGTVKTRYRTGLQELKLLFSQDIYQYTK